MSKGGWTTVSASDIQPEPGPTGPHHWGKVKWMHWALCSKCGLVALKNKPSDVAARLGCGYKAILRAQGAPRPG